LPAMPRRLCCQPLVHVPRGRPHTLQHAPACRVGPCAQVRHAFVPEGITNTLGSQPAIANAPCAVPSCAAVLGRWLMQR